MVALSICENDNLEVLIIIELIQNKKDKHKLEKNAVFSRILAPAFRALLVVGHSG